MFKPFWKKKKPPLTRLHCLGGNGRAAVDIVFIHGLDGDPFLTWRFGQEPSWQTWIAEKFPSFNVWSLEYRIRSSWWNGGSMPLYDRALNVLATISSELDGNSKIILICHSYGGLVAKEMLKAAFETATEYRSFCDRVAGIVFLGTPHNGSAIPHYLKALNVAIRASEALTELRQNGSELRQLDQWFRQKASTARWNLRVFYETLSTKGVRVVDENSSDPSISGVTPIGVDTDHIDLSKPSEPDVRVKRTLNLIEEVVHASAPGLGWQLTSSVQQPFPPPNIGIQFANIRHHLRSDEEVTNASGRVAAAFTPAESQNVGSPGTTSPLPQEDIAEAVVARFQSTLELP